MTIPTNSAETIRHPMQEEQVGHPIIYDIIKINSKEMDQKAAKN